MGALAFLPAVSDLLKTLMQRVLPDPTAQANMQLELAKMAQAGELDFMHTQMSAIIAEESSPDPWTSRARPSFMYVMYIMILMGIPVGILYTFNPAAAMALADGVKGWLAAIPDSLWTLFGVGYTGYAINRTIEKVKGVAS